LRPPNHGANLGGLKKDDGNYGTHDSRETVTEVASANSPPNGDVGKKHLKGRSLVNDPTKRKGKIRELWGLTGVFAGTERKACLVRSTKPPHRSGKREIS